MVNVLVRAWPSYNQISRPGPGSWSWHCLNSTFQVWPDKRPLPLSSALHMVLRVSGCSTPEYEFDKGPSFPPAVLSGAWYSDEWNQVQTNTDHFF